MCIRDRPVIDTLREKNLLEESDGAQIVRLDDYDLPPCLILRSDGATLYALSLIHIFPPADLPDIESPPVCSCPRRPSYAAQWPLKFADRKFQAPAPPALRPQGHASDWAFLRMRGKGLSLIHI